MRQSPSVAGHQRMAFGVWDISYSRVSTTKSVRLMLVLQKKQRGSVAKERTRWFPLYLD